MARVTVEDCVDKVPNRFELVLLSAHRARQIASGSPVTVDRDNDKNPVVALREVAEKTITPDDLKEDLIHSLQKQVEVDEPEPDAVPMLPASSQSVSTEIGGSGEDAPVEMDRMTEEDLLRRMEELTPPDNDSRSF